MTSKPIAATAGNATNGAQPDLEVRLSRLRAALTGRVPFLDTPFPPFTLVFSVSDGDARAVTAQGTGASIDAAWMAAVTGLRQVMRQKKLQGRFLRLDWIERVETLNWGRLRKRLRDVKRNYCRRGIALDAGFLRFFLEQELNAAAMLYGGNKISHCIVNEKNFLIATRRKYGASSTVDFSDDHSVYLLESGGLFCGVDGAVLELSGPGRDTGRRAIPALTPDLLNQVIRDASDFLARQVRPDGQFVYGYHPCFDREIKAYNTLRHTSTVYAMLEAWEVTRNSGLKAAIDRAVHFLTQKLIRTYSFPDGEQVAYLQDANNEVKLGGSAVCLLALVKYTELTGDRSHLALLDRLALGIRRMQDPVTGKLIHVLNANDLSTKETFRIIYYDGEAAFGLMRLYGLTKDPRWLQTVEKAFNYFIAQQHWKSHDHWLSYCVNELTLYRPEERYYQFGIRNVAGHLDFVIERITTFPTLLELMMASHKMILRLQGSDEHRHLLGQLDLEKFYRALETRARYLVNGFFWPEVAMYFKNPQRILGSFFIRHHSFRVRIDDVEHYLSGYVAYLLHYLRGPKPPESARPVPEEQARLTPDAGTDPPLPAEAVLAWGGDVNLGRRQHYVTAQLGHDNVLDIPELRSADLSIVNLECVVSTLGEQGVTKGEGGPYYYRARPEMLRILTAAQIGAVAAANNHSGDYGPQALLQQRDILEQLGIASAGSGRTRDEAFRAAFCQAGDLRVALFSVDATQHHFAATEDTPGTAFLPLQDANAWRDVFPTRIAEARQQADLVFVAVHWGANNADAPDADEIMIGHVLIDAGADAVLGASAHRLQGVEIYRNKPIIHDAGDLLFDSVRNQFAEGGLFRLGLSKEGVNWCEFIPIGVGFGFSRRLRGDAARTLVQRYERICQSVGTVLQCTGEQAHVALLPAAEGMKRSGRATRGYRLDVLRPHQVEAPHGQVQEVPEDARILPVTINGLTLLGVRLHPKEITRRRMLWVESWWNNDRPITENLRLSYTAISVGIERAMEWGRGMDHDPCDWMLPTSRWTPGRIYRDHYGLRPPRLELLRNAPLRVEIRVLGGGADSDFYTHPVPVPVRLPPTGADVQPRLP